MTKLGRFVAAIAVLASFVIMSLPTSTHGWNAEPDHFGRLEFHEDSFWLYDFESTEKKISNVDYGMSLLFYRNASIGVVKNLFDDLKQTGSPMYALLSDGPSEGGWQWDEDKGRKEGSVVVAKLIPGVLEPPVKHIPCKFEGNDLHYRVYAPSDDSFYTMGRWGFYVVASIHFDHDECSKGYKVRWSGESELAEHRLSEMAREELGRGSHTVREDALDWNNGHKTVFVKSSSYPEGVSHAWRSDGKATAIEIRPYVLK